MHKKERTRKIDERRKKQTKSANTGYTRKTVRKSTEEKREETFQNSGI